MEITISSLSDLPRAAHEFVGIIGGHRIFAFRGQMGVGKTTFISAVCRALGVTETVTSPTFAIVNEYEVEQPALSQFPVGSVVYHFDFYRLNRLEEVYDLGYEDYLYSGSLCFIEWPDLMTGLLPDDAVWVDVSLCADGSRTLSVSL